MVFGEGTDVAGAGPGLEAGTGSLCSWCDGPPGSTGCDVAGSVAADGIVSRSIVVFPAFDSIVGVVATGFVSPPSGAVDVGLMEAAGAIDAAPGAVAVPSDIGNPGVWS